MSNASSSGSRLPGGAGRPAAGGAAADVGRSFLTLDDLSSPSPPRAAAGASLMSSSSSSAPRSAALSPDEIRGAGAGAGRLPDSGFLAQGQAQRGRALDYGPASSGGPDLARVPLSPVAARATPNSRGSRLGAQMGKRAAAAATTTPTTTTPPGISGASGPVNISGPGSAANAASRTSPSFASIPAAQASQSRHRAQESPPTRHNNGSSSSNPTSMVMPTASTPPQPRRPSGLKDQWERGAPDEISTPASASAPSTSANNSTFSSSTNESPAHAMHTDATGPGTGPLSSSNRKLASSNINIPHATSKPRGAGVNVAALAAQWDSNNSSPSPSPSKGRQDTTAMLADLSATRPGPQQHQVVQPLFDTGAGRARGSPEKPENVTGAGPVTMRGRTKASGTGTSSADSNRARAKEGPPAAAIYASMHDTLSSSSLTGPSPPRPSTESAKTDSTIRPIAETGVGVGEAEPSTSTTGLRNDVETYRSKEKAADVKPARKWPLGDSDSSNEVNTGIHPDASFVPSTSAAAGQEPNSSVYNGARESDSSLGSATTADDSLISMRTPGRNSSKIRPTSPPLSPEYLNETLPDGQRRLSRASSYGNMGREMETQARHGDGTWSSSSSMSSSSANGPKVGRLSRLQYNKADAVSFHPGSSVAANWDTRPNASSSAKRSSYMRQTSNSNLLSEFQRRGSSDRHVSGGSGSVSPLPRDSGRQSTEPTSSDTPVSPSGQPRELLLPSLTGLRSDGASSPSHFPPSAAQRWQHNASLQQKEQQQQQEQQDLHKEPIAPPESPETALKNAPPSSDVKPLLTEMGEAVSTTVPPDGNIAGAVTPRNHARDSRVSPGYAGLPPSPTVGQLSDTAIVQLGAVPGSRPESLLNANGAPLSSKNVLTIALQKAQSAVQLDSANNVPDAIAAYKQAVRLLQEVMERISPKASKSRKHSRDEERRRLKVIHDTYAERIRLLSIIYSPEEESAELSEPSQSTEGPEDGPSRPDLDSDAEDVSVSAPPLIAIEQHASSGGNAQGGGAGEMKLQRSDSDSSFRSARALRSSVVGALKVPGDSSMLKTSPNMVEDDIRTPTTPYFDVDPNLISLGDESLASAESDRSDRQSQQQQLSLWSTSPSSPSPDTPVSAGQTSYSAAMNRGRRHANQGRVAGSLSNILLSQEDATHRSSSSASRRNERRPSSEGLELANQQKLMKLEQADQPAHESKTEQNSYDFPASGDARHDEDPRIASDRQVQGQQQQQSRRLAHSQSKGSGGSSSSLLTVRPRAITTITSSHELPQQDVGTAPKPFLVNATTATGTIHQRRKQGSSATDSPRPLNSSPSLSSSSSPAIGTMPSPDPSAPVSTGAPAAPAVAAAALGAPLVSSSSSDAKFTATSETEATEEGSKSFSAGRKRAASQPNNRRPSIPQAFLMGQTVPGQPNGPPPVPRITRKASMPLSPLSPSAQGPTAGLRVMASTNAAQAIADRSAGHGGLEQLRFPSPAPSASSGYHALGTPISPYGNPIGPGWLGAGGKLGAGGAIGAGYNPEKMPTLADVFPSGLPSMHFAGPTFASNTSATSLPWLGVMTSLPDPSAFLPTVPIDSMLKPFHTMRLLLLSMQRGAYLSQRLYVPKELWSQPGGSARLLALDTKIKMLELVSNGLEAVDVAGRPMCKPPSGQNPGMEAMFASRFAKQLEDFDAILVEVQNTLAKKLGFVDGWSASSSSGKKGGSAAGGDSGAAGGSGIFGSKFTRGLDRLAGGGKEGENMNSSSSSSSTLVSDSPAGGYVDVLSRTFARSHSMALHLGALRRATGKAASSMKDDPTAMSPTSVYLFQSLQQANDASTPSEEAYAALPAELKSHIEAKLKRASTFFANVILRFVLKDLAILMDKSVKRNSVLFSE